MSVCNYWSRIGLAAKVYVRIENMATVRYNRIVPDPRIMTGKPTIRGTRITIELLLRQLAQGVSIDDILRNYPRLQKADILAVLAYAREMVAEERVFAISDLHGSAKTKALA